MKNLYHILLKAENDIAILIDPDKSNQPEQLAPLIKKINLLKPLFIFIGGSSVDPADFDRCTSYLKENTEIPLIIFPGSHKQVNLNADGILFLSLISGRNPDFLIGHQVESAAFIKKSNLESIATGYILIDGGKPSSVSYMSQTTPIPADQFSIAVHTAMAGELLGLKAIFLDAGSGAKTPVSPTMVKSVKDGVDLPVIVGGGIKSITQVEQTFKAGANLVVIGNKIEEDLDFLLDLKNLQKTYV